MSGGTSRLEVDRIDRGKVVRLRDLVVKERPLTILLDEVEIATIMCTPTGLDYLAVGFLFAEGFLKGKKDIKRVLVDDKDGVVWVETRAGKKISKDLVVRRAITTGCGRGLTFIDRAESAKKIRIHSKLTLRASSVPVLMREFLIKSRLYRTTGGSHSAALCSAKKILVFNEDIGRHSAVDKVFGECVLKSIRTKDRVLVTSGRISSEIVIKAARSSVPIIISKSAPTDLAVSLARDFGVTIVGFVRGPRMNAYSNEWRIRAG